MPAAKIALPVFLQFTALLVPVPAALAAQACPDGRPYDLRQADAEETQEVTLTGGATYLGRVLSAGDPVRFELLSGDVLEIARERIACLRPVAGLRLGGEFWPEDPNSTRLFFGPTGRALRAGDGYFSVFEIVMPFLSIGATDRLTLSGGMPLVFSSDGIDLAWLAPKFELVRTASFRGSLGVLAFFLPDGGGSAGVLYGVGTFGRTSDRAVTAAIGWGYDRDSGIHDAPALMAGFEARLGRNTKLISENYLFPAEDFGIVSLGPRFFGERLSADVGLAMPVDEDMEGFFVFPVVNFVWNW
jgi:hypothetical protein